jgi:group I intron endonuclease
MARGIYKIINVVNNKFYVGSSVDLKRRKAKHFSELRHNKHNNRHLQAAWLKYGEQAFVFVVVEEVADDVDLLAAENIWLQAHVGKDYCYNLGVNAVAPMLGFSGEKSPTWGRKRTSEELSAQSWAGRKHKEEAKQKIRERLIGKPRDAAVRAKISAALTGEGNYWYGKARPEHGAKVSKPVEATDTAGTVTVYTSISVLRAALGLKPSTVNRALKSGKPLTKGKLQGWSFKYVDPA